MVPAPGGRQSRPSPTTFVPTPPSRPARPPLPQFAVQYDARAAPPGLERMRVIDAFATKVPVRGGGGEGGAGGRGNGLQSTCFLIVLSYYPRACSTPRDSATAKIKEGCIRRALPGSTALELAPLIAAGPPPLPPWQAPHKVNLGSPQKTILVSITRATCGVAVVDRFKEL